MKIEIAGLTDTGLLRKNNEDNLLIDQEHNLFLVADGMGGHAAGEVASRLAVDTVQDFINKTENHTKPTWPFPTSREFPLLWQRLMASIMAANGVIYKRSREDEILAGMGTTVVATILSNHEAIHAHVGDSRLYISRNGRLTLTTEDHSWIQEQMNSGNLTLEEANRHPLRNVITRALGGAPVVSVDIGVSENNSEPNLSCNNGPGPGVGDSYNDVPSPANQGPNSVMLNALNGSSSLSNLVAALLVTAGLVILRKRK